MSDELQLLVNYRGLAFKQPIFHYDPKKFIKNSVRTIMLVLVKSGFVGGVCLCVSE